MASVVITSPPAGSAQHEPAQTTLGARLRNTVQQSITRFVGRFKKRKRSSATAAAAASAGGGADDLHDTAAEGSTAGRGTGRKRKQTTASTRGQPAVPVTVHRLSNVSFLDHAGGLDDDGEGDDGDARIERSAATSQHRQRAPSQRLSGVNPVDVLGQICREALEDELAALHDAHAAERDRARRAETAHRVRALRAFSAELDSRLYDLTELLDTNRALAAQLRREQRQISMLRAELLQLRRRRYEVGLDMDEVRRTFMAEQEQANRRAALNESMQEMEVALARSAADAAGDNEADDADADDPTAGLECLLHRVADDVSSKAPDAQAGLLSQLQALNARLVQLNADLDQGRLP
ncbi:hypothetical protein KEM52_000646 [Ascosphaera acerosa]|nr:hypothetical protein KEM52_000646 [Ascosphaera acerosa]